MGSHGGATAEGQTEVLAARGVIESSVGAPIRATMEVVSLGHADGIPLFLDRNAAEASGVVLINRVKPHTDFVGPVESGLMKQLVIGLGKQTGADHYHRLGVVRGLEETIPTAARALLEKVNVVLGVALVENERHQTAVLRVVAPDDIEQVERELLELARRHLPGLPLDDIDLLIVDEIGKDISGNGLDSNVVGKAAAAYSVPRPRPRISRIFVRDLTEDTHGNAAGLGVTDAITTRLLEKIDAHTTATNAFTSCAPEDAKTPAVFACDRDAIVSLLTTVRPADGRGPAPGPHPQHHGPGAPPGLGRLPRGAAGAAGRRRRSDATRARLRRRRRSGVTVRARLRRQVAGHRTAGPRTHSRRAPPFSGRPPRRSSSCDDLARRQRLSERMRAILIALSGAAPRGVAITSPTLSTASIRLRHALLVSLVSSRISLTSLSHHRGSAGTGRDASATGAWTRVPRILCAVARDPMLQAHAFVALLRWCRYR